MAKNEILSKQRRDVFWKFINPSMFLGENLPAALRSCRTEEAVARLFWHDCLGNDWDEDESGLASGDEHSSSDKGNVHSEHLCFWRFP